MKNTNGFGSIICLDKTGKKRRKPYAVRITVGWKDGKQVRKYLGYYATQADALIALAEYHKNHVDLDLLNLTLTDVYQRWINQIEKKASYTVLKTHDMCFQRFGHLANKQIKEIKTIHLQDWLDGIDLKPGTKGKIRSTMSQLFEFAVANDIVNKNYAKSIKVGEKIEKTGAIFTPDEIKKLWEHSDQENVQDILILIYTGMRVGEALAMTKDNINLEDRYMIGGSKTEAGIDRVIPIHKDILPFVEERYNRGKYLIYTKNNTKIAYNSMKSRFNNQMKYMGMSHKLHDTRKTGVSIMHSAGIPMEVVRIIVGHSGKGVTEKVYLFKEPTELVEYIDYIKIDK